MESSSIRPREELEKVLGEVSQAIEFKDAHLELPSADNSLPLIELLKEHAYKDETIVKSLGAEFDSDLNELWLQRLQQPLSLILVSNTTGKIIGTSFMGIIERDFHPIASNKDTVDEASEKMRDILTSRLDEFNVFKRFGVDKAIRLIFLCVHREHRKQGLATKLMQATLLFCKDVGLKPVCLYAEGTSNQSQHILEKAGFESLYSAKYADYRYKGEVVFNNTGENENVKFYVKKL